MQEIEIKFKVNNVDNIISTLEKYGCKFSDKLYQKDSIFVPDILDTSSSEGKKFIRIRQENERVELNLKIQSKEKLSSEEIEFVVSDYIAANKFLDALGLHRWVEVIKERITTKYKGFNICIDKVEHLGSFIEIEKITQDNSNLRDIENEILELAEFLSIDTYNRVNSHYDTMISELNIKENDGE